MITYMYLLKFKHPSNTFLPAHAISSDYFQRHELELIGWYSSDCYWLCGQVHVYKHVLHAAAKMAAGT